MPAIPSFDEYVASLGPLTTHVDPTAVTPEATTIREAAQSVEELPELTLDTLTGWAQDHPAWVSALGLAVGLSQEKLKNNLRHRFGTSSWTLLARTRSRDLITQLDEDHNLISLLSVQTNRSYDFGDILVARAGPRAVASRGMAAGRRVEDWIEDVARGLALPYVPRTRFTGSNNRTAPCDLAIPNGTEAAIVVAAKGFDSTGSKLTDAVREVEEMASVRLPRQYVMAVIDGIGWKSRAGDLRRIYHLWQTEQIDGLYTLAALDRFRDDLQVAARIRGLLP